MTKKMKPQRLALFTHEDQQLFYVMSINVDRYEHEATVSKQYSRAKSSHKAILENRAGTLSSGFIFSVINTNISGWEVQLFDDVYDDMSLAHEAKQTIIEEYAIAGWTYVGTTHNIRKGVYGSGKTPPNWNKKMDVSKMTRDNIIDRVKFLFQMQREDVQTWIINAVYWAMVQPDDRGPKSKNFGSYQVDSLANMFLFVRNLRGIDLP